ncbi:hypothetical protein K1719_045179 [Acacia pycnantha]|nr:hypothetical protein K1719_045179 [Acacia pycnantha]
MSNNEIEAAQQQMVELQHPLLSSQPSDHLCSDLFQQQQHVKDNEVTIDMKEMIQDCGDGFLLPECCIYRVPLMLRQLNEEAYTPKLVSVGPFHYGNERLKDMERHKQIMFKRFIDRAESSLDDLVRLVKHSEPKVRGSYSETINLTEDQLVKLTLTDAAFIIQLFIMFHEANELHDDAKLSLPNSRHYIFEDLLLLENQLPFFVIEELFNKAFPHDSCDSLPSFLELTYDYFKNFGLQNLEPNIPSFLELTYDYFKSFVLQNLESDTVVTTIKHFTDLLRSFYLQGKVSKRELISLDQFGSNILSYNANALQEAGIKLKAGTSKCLLDLKFERHVLEIPKIFVEDRTELVFRNMIALEQCLYPDAAYIVDYALVLDCLIDTHKDVDLLVHKKIVDNFILGHGNDVASLFNGLGKNVLQSNIDSEYLDICKRLNRYCENPWHKMKATLKRDYCRTPWQIVASIAAIVLLILTFVQTILAILK